MGANSDRQAFLAFLNEHSELDELSTGQFNNATPASPQKAARTVQQYQTQSRSPENHIFHWIFLSTIGLIGLAGIVHWI